MINWWLTVLKQFFAHTNTSHYEYEYGTGTSTLSLSTTRVVNYSIVSKVDTKPVPPLVDCSTQELPVLEKTRV